MNKHLSKNIQNIDMNKTVKIGVSTTEVEKQTHLRKCPLNIYIAIEIYRRK